MNKLYLMSFGAQQKLIEDRCFKNCGEIIFGAVTFMGGSFGCCRKSDCQYCEKFVDMGEAEINNNKENIIVRKLK